MSLWCWKTSKLLLIIQERWDLVNATFKDFKFEHATKDATVLTVAFLSLSSYHHPTRLQNGAGNYCRHWSVITLLPSQVFQGKVKKMCLVFRPQKCTLKMIGKSGSLREWNKQRWNFILSKKQKRRRKKERGASSNKLGT